MEYGINLNIKRGRLIVIEIRSVDVGESISVMLN